MMTASIVGVAPLTAPLRLASGARARASKRTIIVAHADRRATATKQGKAALASLAVRPTPGPRPSQPCPAHPTSHVVVVVPVISAPNPRERSPRVTREHATFLTAPPSSSTPQAAPAALFAQASAAADSEPARSALADAHNLVTQLAVAGDPLDPETARSIAGVLGPMFSVSTLLFIIRIVMTWYPSVPVSRLPWVVAYLPTEPLLKPTRALVPPVGGVDVSPIIWVGMISFMNEILLGKQGLLILLSNKQMM
jgi:YggT family protein